MEVINLDINGNVIKDLSKVKLPKDLNQFVFDVYRKGSEKKRRFNK